MALDPRISLGGRPANVGGIFEGFQRTLNNVQLRGQREAEAPFRTQILEQQAQLGQGNLQTARDNQRLTSIAQFGAELLPSLKAGDVQGARDLLLQRKQNIEAQLAQNPNLNIDTAETDEALSMLGTIEGVGLLTQRASQAVALGDKLGLFRGQAGGGIGFGTSKTAKDSKGNLFNVTTRQNRTTGQVEPVITPLSGSGQPVGQLSLVSGSGLTGAETVGQKVDIQTGVGDVKAQQDIDKSEAVETGKLTAQLKLKPKIQSAIKIAEAGAKERGEVLTDLGRMNAALPGLNEVVLKLKGLAPIVTSTHTGQFVDAAIKEFGFGATKGSTARAKFISIIDNQVLPLLKQTFGAAFTVQEGENLKATMGDPNSAPAEKMAQLDAFIEQKRRNIQEKERQLGIAPQKEGGEIMIDAQGNRARVFPDGSFEEL